MGSQKSQKNCLLIFGIFFIIFSSNVYKLNSHEQDFRTCHNFLPITNYYIFVPMLYNGVYHLFYLHNSNEVLWGSSVWGHFASTNIFDRTPESRILQHSPKNLNKCWFKINSLKDLSDQSNNRIMILTPQNQITENSFRDLPIARILPDGNWQTLVGNKRGSTTRVSSLLEIKDFLNWIQANHPECSYPNSGLWGCPNLFPIFADGKFVIDAETPEITNNIKQELKSSSDDVYTNRNYDVHMKRSYYDDYNLARAYRTAYHFQPAKGFMNDPNAPMLYEGIYHLFYQHNPDDTVWGSPIWGHSTSTDMVNWTPQPIILRHESPENRYGSWSGSATILPGNKPTILFTGTINPHKEQVQNLALPKNLSDPYLKEWYLASNNPIMTLTPQNQMIENSFRDPTTAWILPDRYWRTLVGHKRGNIGVSLLFKSKDFYNWVQVDNPIYSYPNTGMWECPDFFPVFADGKPAGVETSVISNNVKHVLKVSLDDPNHDVYTIGKYDAVNDAYTPDQGYMNDSSLRYDYGKYYGSKTFFDYSTNRRILFGWANESSSVVDDEKKGWAGIYAIPREIWLEKLGKQLIQWPIREIEKLREKPVRPLIKELGAGSKIEVSGITANQADVSISFMIKDLKNVEKFDTSWTDPQLLCSQMGASIKGGLGPFGLLILASIDLKEYTAVFFRIFQGHTKLVVLMCSDQSRSSVNSSNDKTPYGAYLDVDPVSEGLSLRVLIDNSVIESFGAKGKSVITARVYPTKAISDQAHLFAFNYGMSSVEIPELTGWSMMKADIA